MRKAWFLVGAVVTLIASPALAQSRDTIPNRGTPAQRAEMEQRLRARLAEVVSTRLGLTPEQATRLQQVDQRYEPERRALMRREMQARRALRQQIAAGDTASQSVTAGLLDQLTTIQRERADLSAREQRELATFLTPVQRAQLLALQADLQRRVMNAHRRGRR